LAEKPFLVTGVGLVIIALPFVQRLSRERKAQPESRRRAQWGSVHAWPTRQRVDLVDEPELSRTCVDQIVDWIVQPLMLDESLR
jgi:hypothetical protein